MIPKREAIRRVLIITLVLNLLVAIVKIVLGLISGALAIAADGLHSLIDSSGNVIGLVANHIAWQPADDDHPYGHRRFEALATLIIGALLLFTASEIIRGAIEQLTTGASLTITPLMFAVMVGTLVINIAVNRYQVQQGERLQSTILLADAANTGADVVVTISVLISMALVALGWSWADVVMALAVVVFILRAAWDIIRQTARILVDTAPYSADELRDMVAHVEGVEHIVRARSRGPRDAAHIDIDVQVSPGMTVVDAAHVADAIRDSLNSQLEGVDEIEVHFTPSRYQEQPASPMTREIPHEKESA